MLKPAGWHVFVIPIRQGFYEESFGELSDEERVLRFGQNDHVRSFGKADMPAHIGSILKLPGTFDAKADFSKDVLEEANIPKKFWYGCNSGPVFCIPRDAYRLGALP
jgi:phosphoglycolate phosphatase